MVDTSFVLALGINEAKSPQVRRKWELWISSGERLNAPSLLAYELAGTLRNKVHRGKMAASEARAMLDLCLALPVELHRPVGLHRLAYSAAEEIGLPTAYDCHFLALAEMLGAALWTLDEQFQHRAVGRYPAVYTIGA